MLRIARCLSAGRIRAWAGGGVLVVVVAVASGAGCTSEVSPLPPMTLEEVVGVLIGPSGSIASANVTIPPVPEGTSLASFMTAYTEAKEKEWVGDTTPQLSAIFELEDGRRVILHFSEEYPPERAEAIVQPSPGPEATAESRSEFRVRAPGLENAVKELAGVLKMPVELDPEPEPSL